MSKNNLRGITLVRGPIWGIHSLTLIISWRILMFRFCNCNKHVIKINIKKQKEKKERLEFF